MTRTDCLEFHRSCLRAARGFRGDRALAAHFLNKAASWRRRLAEAL